MGAKRDRQREREKKQRGNMEGGMEAAGRERGEERGWRKPEWWRRSTHGKEKKCLETGLYTHYRTIAPSSVC